MRLKNAWEANGSKKEDLYGTLKGFSAEMLGGEQAECGEWGSSLSPIHENTGAVLFMPQIQSMNLSSSSWSFSFFRQEAN